MCRIFITHFSLGRPLGCLPGVEMGKGMEGKMGRSGLNTHSAIYIKQIINKDLLYSTGNSTQYSVIMYMGKEP